MNILPKRIFLGTMLGYDRLLQCKRYLEMKKKTKSTQDVVFAIS